MTLREQWWMAVFGTVVWTLVCVGIIVVLVAANRREKMRRHRQ